MMQKTDVETRMASVGMLREVTSVGTQVGRVEWMTPEGAQRARQTTGLTVVGKRRGH